MTRPEFRAFLQRRGGTVDAELIERTLVLREAVGKGAGIEMAADQFGITKRNIWRRLRVWSLAGDAGVRLQRNAPPESIDLAEGGANGKEEGKRHD